jgi:hypothetical protein
MVVKKDDQSLKDGIQYPNETIGVLIWGSNMVSNIQTGNALARVQRVHAPTDLWDIAFSTRWFWGFYYYLHPLILRPKALFYRRDRTRRSKFLTHALPYKTLKRSLNLGLIKKCCSRYIFLSLSSSRDSSQITIPSIYFSLFI